MYQINPRHNAGGNSLFNIATIPLLMLSPVPFAFIIGDSSKPSLQTRIASAITTKDMTSPENASEENRGVDLTGQTLGDYEIIRRLGRGGMADVYLADQISLKRNVAFKVLKQSLSSDESYVARFRREAQAAAALVQANIVQIYEVGVISGHYFIAQEYVPGRNLKQHIVRYGALDPAMTVNVIRQVAAALQKAGQFNVIHRDIKPENIILSATGEVKVADFGLARVNDKKSDGDLTQVGITMGTPLYMSPEQVEGTPVDPRSDIYSLGITAYHMLAGKPPYDGENAMAIAIQHVQNKPESLLDLRPDVPRELIHLIEKMTAKAPDDRPENAGEVLKELRKIKVDSDTDWNELAARLSSDAKTDLQKSKEIRSETARRLQAVMRGNLRSWWTNPLTTLAFLACGIGGIVGGLYWGSSIPNQLLDRELSQAQEIPKRENIVQQYRSALLSDPTESNWQAVIKLFPDEEGDEFSESELKREYRNYARERLGEIYLSEGRFHDAQELYSKQISGDNLGPRLSIVKEAGFALALDGQGYPDMLGSLAYTAEDLQHLNSFLRPLFEKSKRELAEQSHVSKNHSPVEKY